MTPKSVNEWGWGNVEPVTGTAPFRLIVRSWGQDKTGKNHFGFTAPGPIGAIHLDPGGAEGVVQKFLQPPLGPKEIRIKQLKFNRRELALDQKAAIDVRDEFEDIYRRFLHVARSIQLDETEMWEVYRFAEFDQKSDAPNKYEGLNARYRTMIQDAVDAGVNLQLIQKMKEKWGTTKKTKRSGETIDAPYPTGEFEPTGFKEAKYIVQANLEHCWEKERGFYVKCHNVRQNMELAGEEFTNLDWSTLGQLVFPDSTSESWA